MKTVLVVYSLVMCASVSIAQPICDFRGKDSLSVSFVGDTISIWDLAACGNCASKFATSVSRSVDSIYIIQEDTAYLMATCDCLFNLRASLMGIPAGTYTAVIYRDWHLKYHNSTQPLLIGTIRFQYSPQTTASFSYGSYQSGCLTDAVSQRTQSPPREPMLFANFPNPFNPSTIIRFETSTTEPVVIKVFDMLGREVQTLLSEVKIPGQHSVKFDAPPGLSSGFYFYRMQVGSFRQTKTMLLLR
jgi:hypothetical protein